MAACSCIIHIGALIMAAYSCIIHVKNRADFSTLMEISRILGNPDRFRVIFGKWNNSRKFHEILKYDFYGLKKLLFFCSLSNCELLRASNGHIVAPSISGNCDKFQGIYSYVMHNIHEKGLSQKRGACWGPKNTKIRVCREKVFQHLQLL